MSMNFETKLITRSQPVSEEHELDRVRFKQILKDLQIENKSEKMYEPVFMDSFHSELADDHSTEKADRNCGLIDFFFKHQTSNLLDFANAEKKEDETDKNLEDFDDDLASIYEDEKSKTKTIFRSKSFDDPIEKIIFDGERLTTFQSSIDLMHGFYLEEFSDTFNLEEDKMENTNFPIENVKADNRDIEDSKPNPILPELLTSSANSSLDSSKSIQFNDISMANILDDLGIDNTMDKTEDRLTSPENGLNMTENQIVNAIVLKLKQQLEPTLERLTKESEKYELIKQLYKLPSVSNLNEEFKLKCSKKGKQFMLNFDNDVIKEMVNAELIKKKRRENVLNKHYVISAKDQLRLDFNKYRRLDTIEEEYEHSLNSESCELTGKYKTGKQDEFECMKKNYSRIKDTRTVPQLETQELILMLHMIKNGKLKDLSKVGHLVTMFEMDKKNDTIGMLDNQQLKETILLELERRKVI